MLCPYSNLFELADVDLEIFDAANGRYFNIIYNSAKVKDNSSRNTDKNYEVTIANARQ